MKHALFQNWQLKLVAVVLALMVWLTIQRVTSSERVTVYNVRVEPQLSQEWRVAQMDPARVTIEIRGERSGMIAVSADHFQVRPVLAPPINPGDVAFELKLADVMAPPDIRVMDVQPRRVVATLEPVTRSAEK